MAYEATAELYKREYDLAKKRAQSQYEQQIAELATQYRQANRGLEANLESRGILRSGEGMRGRVALGAQEKAAQLGALGAQEEAFNQAGLRYMQQLAELQAKGYTGAEAAPGSGTGTGGGGAGTGTGTPGTVTRPVEPAPTPPAEQPRVKPPKPSNPPPGYDYVWNEAKWAWELVALTSGGPAQPGMPAPPPGQGGPNEIGSGGRPIGTPPPGFVPPGTAPGVNVGGPDRRLPNGGAVVDGIYIPPGTIFAPAPAPRPTPRPISGRY
jgi:hypothetical protein